jgi:hypothetical protein
MKNRKSLFPKPFRHAGKRRKRRDFLKPNENSENVTRCALIFARNQWKNRFSKRNISITIFSTPTV